MATKIAQLGTKRLGVEGVGVGDAGVHLAVGWGQVPGPVENAVVGLVLPDVAGREGQIARYSEVKVPCLVGLSDRIGVMVYTFTRSVPQ